MTRFERPTRGALMPFLKMEVTPAQAAARLVAPNAVTLAQASFDPASQVWFIYDDDTPAGMVAMTDLAHPEAALDEGDDTEGFFLWRLFIDQHHQGNGHGKAAVAFAIEQARALGRPKLYLTHGIAEVGPARFYEALGFVPTGRFVDDEREMVLGL